MPKRKNLEKLFEQDRYALFKTIKLPSGLKLHWLHMPEANFVHTSFIVHCGGRQDPEGKEGLAHFVEHLVSKSGLTSLAVLESFFSGNGGFCMLGRTSHGSTTYSFSLPAEQSLVERGVSLFSNMLLSQKLRGHTPERRVINNEFLRSRSDNIDWERRGVDADNIFYWHPFFKKTFSTIGNKETIASFSNEDANLFHSKYYIPSNIEIVGVGGFSSEEIMQIISQTKFTVSREGKKVNPLVKANPFPPLSDGYFSPNIVNAPDTIINCASPALVSFDYSIHALAVFSQMMQFVLDKKMRETSLGLYNSECYWKNFGDFYLVATTVDAVRVDQVDEVRCRINRCFVEVMANERLFDRIKKNILASFYIQDYTGRDIMMTAVKDVIMHQRILPVKEVYDDMVKLKFIEVADLAQKAKEQLFVSFFPT